MLFQKDLPKGRQEAAEVTRERLRLCALQTHRAAAGALAGMAVLLWLSWANAPKTLLAVWAGCHLCVLTTRWVLAAWVLKEAELNLIRTRRLFQVTAGLSGFMVGCYCLITFPFLETSDRFLVITVCIIWLATSIATMSQIPMQLQLSALIMTGMGATAWMLTATEGRYLLAGAVAVLGFLISAGARDLSRVIGESIRMRFANDALVLQLADQIRISEDANRAKSHFLAAASHDLRQPASSLALFVDALSEISQTEESTRLIEGIGRASGAINDLLGSLLDLSRLDAGIVTPSSEWVMIGSLFSDLGSEFGYKASEKHLKFIAQPGAGALYVDPVLISRAARNLLENAIRYTPVGEVRLLFRRQEQRAQIIVEDTGVGIDPKFRERVFDEYFQLSNPSRNRIEGLGLGLAIVRRIAVLLDASIHLEASPEGGTTAILEFAASRHKPDFSPDKVRTINQAPIEKGIIMIRENDPEVSASLSLLLSRWGYSILEAEDNISAMEICIREPDLRAAISDYRLPDRENGIELLERISKARPACKRILITGDTGTEVLQAAIRSEVTLIHKPLSAARIRDALSGQGREK